MAWRVAESLETLRKQLNTAFPNRSKASDGGIGDAKHASRSSDHNPWVKGAKGIGVVTARDFTHDPKNGLDCNKLAQWLIESRDPRIKYIIWNKRILSSKNSPWKWRPYSGVNSHSHHLHLSVDSDPKLYDSTKPWDLDVAKTEPHDDVAKVVERFIVEPTSSVNPVQNISNETLNNFPADETPQSSSTSAEANQNSAIQSPETVSPPETTDGQTEVTQTVEQQTTSGKVTTEVKQESQQHVAIEKTEPKGFLSKLWKKVAGFFGGTITTDIITEKAAQAQTLGLSPDMWKRIFYLAIAAGAIYLVWELIDHIQSMKRDKEITTNLIEANTTETNIVQLVPPEQLAELQAKGYEIVKR